MPTIKIISNPYTRELKFLSYKEQTGCWEDIRESNPNSKLREDEAGRNFLPFKIKEVVDTIISDYAIPGSKIQILFEGTQDEFSELENVCKEEGIRGKIELVRTNNILENARTIFQPTKDIFAAVKPIIEDVIKEDKKVQKDLGKVSDALKDIIPICVFGNYSSGKSSFINALIGGEVLPCGGDPVTAKIYKIERAVQPDTAKIRFSYLDEAFEILFEGVDYHILKGNIENELIQDIFTAIDASGKKGLYANAGIALTLLNDYEDKDRNDTIISNEIELEIPFSKRGVLGQSYNNFVIFDTPGSNSESNSNHLALLEEALSGFSNGIPVWVTTYESVDSTDNAELCEKVLAIDALDKRFTMIILNKADSSDLDENGFSEKKEQEIREYSSVEKMYAGGIYFISSIMGLGAKKNGNLEDKHYRKVFNSQKDMYRDPRSDDYAALYKYNIMPRQIKEKAEAYSAACPDLIYANSGLYCVEKEMETFASRYACYNKCLMVHVFLNQVVDGTVERIKERTASLTRACEKMKRELEAKKAQLSEQLTGVVNTSTLEFMEQSREFYHDFIEKNLTFRYEEEELQKTNDELYRGNASENHFNVQEGMYEDSRSRFLANVRRNGKELLRGDGAFRDRLGKMKDDFVDDYGEYRVKKGDRDKVARAVNRETSTEVLQIVIDAYKKNLAFAEENLGYVIKEEWTQNAQLLKNKLIQTLAGSDTLPPAQKDEISKVIMNYKPFHFDDDSDRVFIREKFLRGNFLGIQLLNDEKLNIKKLTNRYNDRLSKAISDMAYTINYEGIERFKEWKKDLSHLIDDRITDYNPELRDLSDLIREEMDKISELKENQAVIEKSLSEINQMMAWKTLE